MTLVPTWLKTLLHHSNRWRGVELAGWSAFLLTACSVVVFTLATKTSRLGNDIPVPPLLYPYLAAVSVFFTTCIWILSAARIGVSHDLITDRRLSRAERWFWFTLMMVTAVLMFSGLAGDQGLRAAKSLNWYLFGPLDDPMQDGAWYRKEGMPFAVLTVLGNALALATLVYLGALCNGLILGACEDASDPSDLGAAALRVGEAERRLKSFLVMASALMVTSTLALYLSFATAAQIQLLQDAQSKRLPSADRSAVSTAKETGQLLTVDCLAPTARSGGQSCTLRMPVAEKDSRLPSDAAYMALVAGLSFTGVLFILFSACGSALSDRAAELAREQRRLMAATASFNLKEWREQTGLADNGAGAQAIQGLALVAPALTGLLTLVNS